MKTVYHFFRLIRFLNLLVIGLTMVLVQYFLKRQLSFSNDSEIFVIAFNLLVISTILIAAAGNIINDYFDVKADRINKPDRLIIGLHIKRRWAMVLHWSFNLLGFIISLYIGYILKNIWVPISAFGSINLLWFYSVYYKRKAFTGNLIVAFLLGAVPFYVLILNYTGTGLFAYHNLSIFIVCLVALLMNLIRELIKDIIDVRGDLRLGAKTYPIKYGIKKTKYLISIIAVLLFALMAFYVYFISFTEGLTQKPDENTIELNYFIGTLSLAGIIMLTALFFAMKHHKKKTYKLASNLIKFSILFGLLTLLFI